MAKKKLLLDISGGMIMSTAIVVNSIAWLSGYNVNQALTYLLSFFGLLYIIVRTYNGWKNGKLERKGKRLDNRLKEIELKEKQLKEKL